MRDIYDRFELNQADILANPFEMFDKWFAEYDATNYGEANAMTLATADAEGKASCRTVLLKMIESDGFIFFTNYNSRKAKDILVNPHGSLLFYWHPLHRQIRIEGKIEKIEKSKSQSYFQSRPKGSQIAAWASPQSEKIKNRKVLEDKVNSLESKFEQEEKLPIPADWGGFKLVASRFEFWQGRKSRLHDRFVFEKEDLEEWKHFRIAP
ncbi:UNVERIFIED_CONTAM: hypothetical protein GTU68_059168 [Idotea baltica]|nr:hypothetical protein [Idotea baltica]